MVKCEMRFVMVLCMVVVYNVAMCDAKNIDAKIDDLESNLLYKNSVIPKNWKVDNRYTFMWEGDFTYGVSEDSKCGKVIIPPHGRFVCSSGKGLSRIMCLTECMINYKHEGRSTVYICTNEGVWKNIYHKEVRKPRPRCIRSEEDV